jgi:signal transduction histidine kinase
MKGITIWYRYILIVIFAYCPAYGQYDIIALQKKILSSYQQAANDSLKLEAITALGNLARNYTGDYSIPDSLCEIAVTHSGYGDEINLLSCNVCMEAGDRESATGNVLPCATEAALICDSNPTDPLCWRTYYNVSAVYSAANQKSQSLIYAYKSLSRADLNHDFTQQAKSYLLVGQSLDAKNEKIEAFRNYLNALNIAERSADKKLISLCYKQLSAFYEKNKLFDRARFYKQKQMDIVLREKPLDSLAYMWVLFDQNEIDFASRLAPIREENISAIVDFAIANHIDLLKNYTVSLYRSYLITNEKADVLYAWYKNKYPSELNALQKSDTILFARLKGYFCEVENKNDSALFYFRKAEKMTVSNPNKILVANFYIRFGQFLARHDKYGEAIDVFKKAYAVAQEASYYEFMLDASKELEMLYSGLRQFEPAYLYAARNKALADSIFNEERGKKILQLQMQFEFDKKQQNDSIEHAHASKIIEVQLQKQKSLTYSGFMALGMAGVILFFVFKNYRNQKDANRLIRERQQQLIQQAKLTSLGQMAAGIAHEISNPLNFINNFSNLSIELLGELKQTDSKDQKNEIMESIGSNLARIEEHGIRAGNIVKSMLDHSHNRTGEKHLVDFNTFCDRTMNLMYQSTRARIPDFKCELHKKFNVIYEVNIVTQDISRVLINLLNNAFYFVYEKQKTDANFIASVWLITQIRDKKLVITVADNGSGVPVSIREKIFQPFFTTKPTGEGSGLGLSLSHDIIVSHGGTLIYENRNDDTRFVITLPV